MSKKTVKESRTEHVQIVFGPHINGAQRLFGGKLVQWIDTVGAVVARRHSRSEVTTAAIDSLEFCAPVPLNSTVVLIGEMTYTGRKSMEVKVETFTENVQGSRKLVNRAYMVFVALDELGNPREIPELVPETPLEKQQYEQGRERQMLRKQRRAKAQA